MEVVFFSELVVVNRCSRCPFRHPCGGRGCACTRVCLLPVGCGADPSDGRGDGVRGGCLCFLRYWTSGGVAAAEIGAV